MLRYIERHWESVKESSRDFERQWETMRDNERQWETLNLKKCDQPTDRTNSRDAVASKKIELIDKYYSYYLINRQKLFVLFHNI